MLNPETVSTTGVATGTGSGADGTSPTVPTTKATSPTKRSAETPPEGN